MAVFKTAAFVRSATLPRAIVPAVAGSRQLLPTRTEPQHRLRRLHGLPHHGQEVRAELVQVDLGPQARVVVLTGSGFDATTTVALVAANGVAYAANQVSIDLPTEITATFAAGA